MGRRGGRGGRGGRRVQDKRTLRRDFANPREDVWGNSQGKRGKFVGKDELVNQDFEAYYKAQGIVPEDEWAAFLEALRTPLPTTFRINGAGQFAQQLRDKLEADFFSHFNEGPAVVDGEVVVPPLPLPWYPEKLAWQLKYSRSQLRKLEWLEATHEYLKRATEAGSISRQEAVSMVPPLFLNIEPHHRVLDMCAAPGSKTMQLLEAIHSGSLQDTGSFMAGTGFVIANDADAQRCNLLTHQTKRMCSPCLMVTNHSGEYFPLLKGSSGPNTGTGECFDRILCDVPCSGDGTLRKAPDIWRRWTVKTGNGLHMMQIRITLQACKLLKVGGRMVYSTCTFNPVEDEAVVAEVLRRTNGAMRLVDVSEELPSLKRMSGKHTWKVKDITKWYTSWEEAAQVGYKLDPSMFPGPDAAEMPLEHCMRFLPHHQDTGGFFVAVLEKVAPCPHVELPSLKHRFLQSKGEGVTPLEGARAAAECACVAAEAAVGALERGDVGGVEEELLTALAATRRIDFAQTLEKTRKDLQGQKPGGGPSGLREAVQQAPEVVDEEEEEVVPETMELEEGDEVAGGGAEELDNDIDGPAGGVEEAADERGGEVGCNGKQEEERDLEEGCREADDNGTAPGPLSGTAPGEAIQGDAPLLAPPSWTRGGGGRNRSGGGGRWQGIDPIVPIEDPRLIQMISDFYGFPTDCPLARQLITRSIDNRLPKKLYLVSAGIKEVLLNDVKEQLKVVSTGLKVFDRHDVREGLGGCGYRISQEGLPFLVPVVTRQVLRLSLEQFLRLMRERSIPVPPVKPTREFMNPLLEGMVKGTVENGTAVKATEPAAESNGEAAPSEAPVVEKAPAATEKVVLTDEEVLEQLKDIFYGGAVAMIRDVEAQELGFHTPGTPGYLLANAPPAVSIWRAKASINVLVGSAECQHLVEKIEAAEKRKGSS